MLDSRTSRAACVARAAGLLTAALALAGCGSSSASSPPKGHGTIAVVAAENQYGSVASQVGGRYVTVASVESDPNTDPHSYEVSASVAQEVSGANVVIQNGVGYDTFMSNVEAASPNVTRLVVDVQHLLGKADSTPNPHLWYDPATMPKVATALAVDFSSLQPSHAAYFQAMARRFDASLAPWLQAIARFKATEPAAAVATTEPVADYLLTAAGATNLTPLSFQLDVMNGVDPSPQDVSLESGLLTQHKVEVLVYNEQVTDSLTESFIASAQGAHIPVVGVYETMPAPGYTYESWMLAEVDALQRAVADGTSTTHL
jgi:zinc/manganese transport system substrate-binding protein